MTLAGVIFCVLLVGCLLSDVIWVIVWGSREYRGVEREDRREYDGLPGEYYRWRK